MKNKQEESVLKRDVESDSDVESVLKRGMEKYI